MTKYLLILFKVIVLFSFMSMFTLRCTNNINEKMIDVAKESFKKVSTKQNLLSHFPGKIKELEVTLSISPPGCPPTFDCSNQTGYIILTLNKNLYKKEVDDLVSDVISYKTQYNSKDNTIINLKELRRNIFPVPKCNILVENFLPIPYFEHYDFNMGFNEMKVEIDEVPYFDYTYTIPSDLQVYVIEAEAGNFWKEDCNEKRPISLKDWKHGYSRGLATSEEENIIVFWAMIW